MEYSEKEVEDYLVKNIRLLNLGLPLEPGQWDLEQQMNLGDYGFADIIVWDYTKKVIHVVEIKKENSKPADFAQCLKYMYGLRYHIKQEVKVKGVVVASGVAFESCWLIQAIPHLRQWTYSVDMKNGLSGEYEPKSSWTAGNGNIGGTLEGRINDCMFEE